MTFLIDLLLHTGFFALLLPFFFFYFVCNIVIYSFVDNLTEVVKDDLSTTGLTEIFTQDQVRNFFNNMNKEAFPILQKAQDSFKEKNELVYIRTWTIFGFIFAVCFTLAGILSFIYEVPFISKVFSNIIGISIIALSEVIIVAFFINKLTIIDSSFINASIIQGIYQDQVNCWYTDGVFPMKYIKLFMEYINK